MTEGGPLEQLDRWLADARTAGVEAPMAMTLATAGADGRPSARVVSLKRLEEDRLVFTTALWTRKVEELRVDPRVAAVFFWPALGRQVRIEGRAEIAERELAEELFCRAAAQSPAAGARLQARGGDREPGSAAQPARGTAGRAGGGPGAVSGGLGRGAAHARPHRVLAGRRGPPARPPALRGERRRLAGDPARAVARLPVRLCGLQRYEAHRNGVRPPASASPGRR